MSTDDLHRAFDKAVADWAAADVECRRHYVPWAIAVERRKILAMRKNEAWWRLNEASDREREGL